MKQMQLKKLDFTNQEIFVGIDVHKKNWSICILTKDFEHKVMTIDPKPEILIGYLKKNFPNANYHSAYEAGYSGFGWHEQLKAGGINSIVVNPADVPTTDKEKKNKNDNIDRRKIARSLRSGELNAIYTPDIFSQEARSLVRTRYQFTKDQTRTMNRIKSLMSFYGVAIPKELEKSHWSRKFIDWLKNYKLKTNNGTQCLQDHIERLIEIRTDVAKVTKQIRNMAKQTKFKENIDFLMSIPGVGIITAMVFMTEIIDINRFKNLDELASFIGISPGEHSSGDKKQTSGMTKRGNRYMRYLLVEAAWMAARHEPALMMAYNEYRKKFNHGKSIIKIARKLLNRIRFVLKNHKPYVNGVVQE
jgi:transposase